MMTVFFAADDSNQLETELRYRVHILLVLSLLVSVPSMVFADDYAVIIGADDYTNLRPLEYSGKDAIALRDRLIKSGFSKDNVYCLFDDAGDNRRLPFRNVITNQIELIAKNAQEDDLLFFWFSGHGVQIDGKGYLCAVDSRIDQPDTMIEVEWAFDQLHKSAARRKMLIVDACRNEVERPGRRSGRSVESDAILQALHRPPEGLLVITSTEAGDIAIEDEKLGHGIFAHFVLEALSGRGDISGDGKMTWREMFDYAARGTRDYAARVHSKGQRPKIARARELSDDDFVIATIGTGRKMQEGVVSKLNSVRMPPLRGKTLKEARALLNRLGLSLGLVQVASGRQFVAIPRGDESRYVIARQEPKPLTKPLKGGDVRLWVELASIN